jgi:peroxiredoxin
LFSLLANGDDAWSQLHKRLQEKDTTVVMVGDSQHIGPATRMAAELKLPFSLIADDSGALRQLLKIGCSASSCSRYAVVLLDRKGAVRYCQDVSNPGTTLNAIELMAATENLGS